MPVESFVVCGSEGSANRCPAGVCGKGGWALPSPPSTSSRREEEPRVNRRVQLAEKAPGGRGELRRREIWSPSGRRGHHIFAEEHHRTSMPPASCASSPFRAMVDEIVSLTAARACGGEGDQPDGTLGATVYTPPSHPSPILQREGPCAKVALFLFACLPFG